MKLAILDLYNHDIGLKVLFPESDYYIFKQEIDRNAMYNIYQFTPLLNIEDINDTKYDTLFIVVPLFDLCEYYLGKKNDFYKHELFDFFQKMIFIINNNNFQKICIFDNYDYDYDPTDIFLSNNAFNIISEKKILFFKRNYNKNKTYCSNIFPFPYIIFGYQCNIHMITNCINNTNNDLDKKNCIFFSGSIFHHINSIYGISRNRNLIFQKIKNKLDNFVFSKWFPHDLYMKEMSKFKYCLDLIGVGDPNIRSFEILSSGSLRMSQRTTLVWPFNDDFCDETYFDDENELYDKISALNNDDNLYNKCLDKQKYIVSTYMNITSLKSYITEKMNY